MPAAGLSDQARTRRLQRKPGHCPSCDSEAIEAGPLIELDRKVIIRDLSCEDCSDEWQETYTLTGSMGW